jgi:hypothetical protein
LLDSKEAAGDVQGAERLKQVSSVAWQHINFFGRYEFRRGLEVINMREIVRQLAPLPVRLASGGVSLEYMISRRGAKIPNIMSTQDIAV